MIRLKLGPYFLHVGHACASLVCSCLDAGGVYGLVC